MFSCGKEVIDQSSFMDFLRSVYIMYRSVHNLGTEDEADVSSPTAVAWMEAVYKSAVSMPLVMPLHSSQVGW